MISVIKRRSVFLSANNESVKNFDRHIQEIVEFVLTSVSEITEKEYGYIEFKAPLPDKRSLVFGQALPSK